MATDKSNDDFAAAIREWAEWNKRGAANAKLVFSTGFRYELSQHQDPDQRGDKGQTEISLPNT